MKAGKRREKWLGALVIGALMVGGVVLLCLRISRERPLSDFATPVFRIPTNSSVNGILWISNSKLAYSQDTPSGIFTYDLVSKRKIQTSDLNQGNRILSDTLTDASEKLGRRIAIEVSHRMASAGIPFPLSANREVEDLCLSPHKDRIAWLLTYSHPRPLDAIIKRLFPSYKARSETSLELWLSRPNGLQMKKIGVLYSDLPPESPDEERHLEWLPDGKRLSFMDKNTLWVIPAEPGR